MTSLPGGGEAAGESRRCSAKTPVTARLGGMNYYAAARGHQHFVEKGRSSRSSERDNQVFGRLVPRYSFMR
jgi:hypothetical protein